MHTTVQTTWANRAKEGKVSQDNIRRVIHSTALLPLTVAFLPGIENPKNILYNARRFRVLDCLYNDENEYFRSGSWGHENVDGSCNDMPNSNVSSHIITGLLKHEKWIWGNVC